MFNLHSVMLKKVGSIAIAIGIVMIIVMTIAFFVLQSLAVIWGYLTTVGVWFVVFGFVLWLAGAAWEYKDQKQAEIKTEQSKTGLE